MDLAILSSNLIRHFNALKGKGKHVKNPTDLFEIIDNELDLVFKLWFIYDLDANSSLRHYFFDDSKKLTRRELCRRHGMYFTQG